MLITRIFSFSHNVFKKLLSWGYVKSQDCVLRSSLDGVLCQFQHYFSHITVTAHIFSQLNVKKFGPCQTESISMGECNTILTLSQTSPGFYASAVQVFRKHCGKRRNCSLPHENNLAMSQLKAFANDKCYSNN